jgi:hypothetical protein
MRSPVTRSIRLGLAALAVTTLTACTSPSNDPTATRTTDERTPTVAAPATPPTDPAPTGAGTAVQITIGDTTVDGELWDNPAARDLAARLPLTLTFSDYNALEKTARLDPALTMEGMPAGDDPNPGEIGWYGPSSDLVLYHGDVGFWNGIARLGTFAQDGIELLADGPSDVTVTLARADE